MAMLDVPLCGTCTLTLMGSLPKSPSQISAKGGKSTSLGMTARLALPCAEAQSAMWPKMSSTCPRQVQGEAAERMQSSASRTISLTVVASPVRYACGVRWWCRRDEGGGVEEEEEDKRRVGG